MAVLLMDETRLDVANPGLDAPSLELASPNIPGGTPQMVRSEHKVNWVEKFRTEIIHGEENPIYINSHQFKSTRYDLI